MADRAVTWCLLVSPGVSWCHLVSPGVSMSKSRYQTPARLGWGQTALMLHPGLARLGKLGPLGGRLSDKETRREEEEDKLKSKKKKRKKISKEEQQRREEEEEDAKYFSNMDLFLYLGLFLFSGGLVVTILLLPLPNTWLLTESLVQVAAGVLLLGLTIALGTETVHGWTGSLFSIADQNINDKCAQDGLLTPIHVCTVWWWPGAAVPCLLASLWRLCCCRRQDRVIRVEPASLDRDVELLIASVYDQKH